MTKPRHSACWGAGTLAFIVGGILGHVAWRKPRVTLDGTVNLVDLLTLLFTVYISVVLYRTLERRKAADALRKTTVMQRFNVCVAHMDKIEAFCAVGHGAYTDLARYTSYKTFEAFCAYMKRCSQPIPQAQLDRYKLLCMELKDLLTHTPPPGSPNPALVTQNGVTTIAPERQEEVRKKLEEARALLWEVEDHIIDNAA